MDARTLLLGVDGGGTRCRALLSTASGEKLAEATAGPANIRFGIEQSFASVLQATTQCLAEASLSPQDFGRIIACLALAGASEPSDLAVAQAYKHPFRKAVFVTDAQAACVGAHGDRDGGIIIIGTGSCGWAEVKGRHCRVGGWGWPISDEGSGAWLGSEALRRTLWAHDGRIPWTGLLTSLFVKFQSDPHAIVRWMTGAAPRDYGAFAPALIDHAKCNDPVASELVQLAAGHIDALAARLVAFGTDRIALAGGLAGPIEPWLADITRGYLFAPLGSAVDGAWQLAKAAAERGNNGDIARVAGRRA